MFKKPRGTRDFSSEEMQKRRYVEDTIRKTFQNFGYQEIQTPTFENLELFTMKSGEEIIEEIYSFEDKGGRKLALRPELTAPVIRFYVEKLQMEAKPLKLFYIGNCYRYDRPQKGRYREFTQAGCELIGTKTPEALAELIAMAYFMLKKTGLKNINLYIGDLTLLSTIFQKFNLSKKQQEYVRPLIDKEKWGELKDALSDFELNDNEIDDFIEIIQTSDLEKIRKKIQEENSAKKQLEKLIKIKRILVENFQITNSEIKMSIVRGLDYYTGTVFEIEAPVLGAEKQLCGGGTYQLIELFGGKETPTSGFAVGFDRTIVALEEEEKDFPTSKLDFFVIPVNNQVLDEATEIAQKLRFNNYSVDIDLKRRNMGKALKYADSKNAKKTIIVGPEELEKQSVTIKDMETGEQKMVKISKIIDKLKK
ncbi:MAG: histidine--tRNA ligase [Candidatus Thermoplasmatota archaeon]